MKRTCCIYVPFQKVPFFTSLLNQQGKDGQLIETHLYFCDVPPAMRDPFGTEMRDLWIWFCKNCTGQTWLFDSGLVFEKIEDAALYRLANFKATQDEEARAQMSPSGIVQRKFSRANASRPIIERVVRSPDDFDDAPF